MKNLAKLKGPAGGLQKRPAEGFTKDLAKTKKRAVRDLAKTKKRAPNGLGKAKKQVNQAT